MSLKCFANLIELEATNHIKELQTVIMDKTSTRNDFIFHADRLIRVVIGESLNQLSYRITTITTPTGHYYEGLAFEKGNCGVSIMPNGEAMEQGLRECCRSIRIGKILIARQEDNGEAKVFYAKLPTDVAERNILLLCPVVCKFVPLFTLSGTRFITFFTYLQLQETLYWKL